MTLSERQQIRLHINTNDYRKTVLTYVLIIIQWHTTFKMELRFAMRCVLLGFFYFNTKVAECITCLDCQDVADISNCINFTVCKDDEVCFIEKVVSPSTFELRYNTGCKKMEYCILESCYKAAYGDSNSRKRKRDIGDDLTVCSQCCYDDICNKEGCGYKQPKSVAKCFSCNEVYDGGPPCTTTVDCDLTLYACSITNQLGSSRPGAYELGCKFKRKQCEFFLTLGDHQNDKNVKCCDATLCNASPYHRKVNKTAIAMNFECPTGIVRPSTTVAPTTRTTTTARPTTRLARPTTRLARSTTRATAAATTLTTTTAAATTTTTTTARPTTRTTAATTTTSAATTITTIPTTAARPLTTTAATTTTTTTATTATTEKLSTTTVTTTLKSTPTPVQYPNQCSFGQNDLCSWIQSHKDDDFDWAPMNGETISPETGPSVDHSTGNGQGTYLYIESSSPRQQGEIARLESPTLSSRRKTCISLWYFMYGDGIGNLKIMLQKVQDTKSEIVLFSISGDQGQRWCPAVVEIPASSIVYYYKLVIQGDVGPTYHGDIAIDDLLISETTCTVTKCNKSGVSAPIVG